jgi:uncharacterized protein (TIGR03437 family)
MAATAAPFPVSLNGVTVTFNGTAAPLAYVSAGQINALVPAEAATLTGTQTASVPVVVKTASGSSAPFNLTLQSAAPAIYTKDLSGTGAALAFDANFNVVTTVGTSPLVLYATGLGMTNPPAATGSLGASAEPLNRVVTLPQVSIGGAIASVGYAGLAPGLHGIYQINVTPNPMLGNQLTVSTGTYSAPTLTLPVSAGTNVTNATGTIDGLYPVAGGSIGISALPTVGTFTAAFDIVSGAKPFIVEAVSAGGTAVININPTQGTWTAMYTVPTAAARQWNFSGDGFTVTDFASGSPFPANIIPASRIDPAASSALNMLPLPNGAGSGANGVWTASGSFTGSHFTIGAATTPGGIFGGFTNLTTRGAQSTTFSLYVDNLLVASKAVSFSTP